MVKKDVFEGALILQDGWGWSPKTCKVWYHKEVLWIMYFVYQSIKIIVWLRILWYIFLFSKKLYMIL
jgi:hypothetical protein